MGEVRVYLNKNEAERLETVMRENGLANRIDAVRFLLSEYETSKLNPKVVESENSPKSLAPFQEKQHATPVKKSDMELLMEDMLRSS